MSHDALNSDAEEKHEERFRRRIRHQVVSTAADSDELVK